MTITSTPGPWTYRKARDHYHIESSAIGFGKAVAIVRHVENDKGWTSERNAAVIAACPQMLAALNRLVAASDGYADMPSHAGAEAEFKAAIESAKSVLANIE